MLSREDAVEMLRTSVAAWNQYRESTPGSIFSLVGAHLRGFDLSGANLSETVLSHADLVDAKIQNADLRRSVMSDAILRRSDMSGANLFDADLTKVNFALVNLNGAVFKRSTLGETTFSAVDLSVANGLDECLHLGPSTVGLDTIIRSKGKIPESFLRGCGVPDHIIQYIPSLIKGMSAIQFYSCFISYSHKDEEFARRLYDKMTGDGLRVWYAPEDLKYGRDMDIEIDEAIRVHDKLLVVLSEDSMKSDWVVTEITNALGYEKKTGAKKLFPISIVDDFEKIKQWKCFDSDHGTDVAKILRRKLILDFSNWKGHDSFEATFKKLLDSLNNDA